MPTVSWGIGKSDVDDFDRSKQFTPYRGKTPSNGVYDWEIKRLKFVAATREKNAQLWVGLELVPRDKSEEKWGGYYITDFIPVSDKTQWRYVPLLDALGISSGDFINKTRTDTDGNIQKIGRWSLDGDMVSAQLKDGRDAKGNERKEIGGYWECVELEDDEDDEDLGDDDYDDEDDTDEDEEYDEDEDGF